MNDKKQTCCKDCKNGQPGKNQACQARRMVEAMQAAADSSTASNQTAKTS